MSPKEINTHILGVILANQYDLMKGKELCGERDNEAVMNELSENNDLETYEPQRIKGLIYKDKKRTLESLILISERMANQNGHEKIKGGCVAVGSK